MANINTGSFAKALEPGVQKWYGMKYETYGEQCKEIFETRTSKRAYEELMHTSMFGMAAIKPEGASVAYDTAQQGHYTRATHSVYALGFIITKEAIRDNQYMELAEGRSRALARSRHITRETVAANVLNRADTAGFTGGDGVTLFNSAHPHKAGGSFSNILATAADLSEAALEQLSIDISKWTDDRGLLIAAKPRKLVVPADLEYEAERILNSELRTATADNDPNALANLGRFPEGFTVNNFLTDTNMWYVLTDVDDGMIHYLREADEVGADNDFDTSNAKFKVEGRESYIWGDPRGIAGSNPA